MKKSIVALGLVSDHADRACAALKGQLLGGKRRLTSQSCRDALDHICEAIRLLEYVSKVVESTESRRFRAENKVSP